MNKPIIQPTKRYSDLKELVNDAAALYGERDAYRYMAGKKLVSKSFINIRDDSMAFSNALNSLGLLGKHIAVIGATSYEWIVAYLGTVNSNSVIVPIDKELPADDIAELINRADVAALVYDKVIFDRIDTVKEKCAGLKYLISIPAEESKDNLLSFSKLIEENRGEFDTEIDNEKMCSILFTSGTTGRSKGVMLTHTSLADNATCMDMDEPVGTVTLSVLPVHHAYCFTCDVLVGLCCGTTCCFNDSMMHLVRNLNIFNPDVVLLVPMIIESLYYGLLNLAKSSGAQPGRGLANKIFGTSLRTIYSGGAYLNPKLIDEFEKFGISLVQGYGMTEFSPRISANHKRWNKKGSVGILIPGCEARIEDGEILVKGKSRMLGYYKDEKATDEALCGEWLRTGDLGYIDEDNFVYITGRKKNLIILSNGENVSPEELENKFNGWLVAKELMVYSEEGKITVEIFPNEDYLKMANITDVQAEFTAIVDKVNSDLPLYKRITRTVVRTEEFEKTASGKIKRKHNN